MDPLATLECGFQIARSALRARVAPEMADVVRGVDPRLVNEVREELGGAWVEARRRFKCSSEEQYRQGLDMELLRFVCRRCGPVDASERRWREDTIQLYSQLE